MKVLWITNILFPDICEYLHRNAPVTGGWMKSLAEELLEQCPNIELAVCSLYGVNKKLLEKKIGRITYFCLPFNECHAVYTSKMEKYWKEVANRYNPDVVHIHGTEFPYGLAYLKANGGGNAVISIQGLVGAYARYSLGGIDRKILSKYKTIYDMLKKSIITLPERMKIQGKLEYEYLSRVNHVMGRTEWDKNHIWAINPSCKYHKCNEILRTPFYSNSKWQINKCLRHSIFLSQAQKPIKGIHILIEAMPLILREFPDTKVIVAGYNFLKRDSLKEKLRFSAYANYVSSLIKKYKLEDKFIFTGLIDEESMAKQYRNANVFVCPSSIENSPNSLGEAQIIGVPCIASYVGGVPSMIVDRVSGLLYRFEEYEMLANLVCKVFNNDELALKLSQQGIIEAEYRHNKKINAIKTYNIYEMISNR